MFLDLEKCGGRKIILYRNRYVTRKDRVDEEIEKIIYMIYHIRAQRPVLTIFFVLKKW